MARIALCLPALPSHAAVHGALGRELARRGHKVVLIGGEGLAPLATREGLPWRTLGEREPHLHGASLARTLIATAGATWIWVRRGPQALMAVAPDLVIADQAEPGAALAADASSCPRITLTAGLPMDRDPTVPPPFVSWDYRADAEGEARNRGGWRVTDTLMTLQSQALLAGCRRYGLTPRGRLDDWVSADLDLRQWPSSLDFPHPLPQGAVGVGPVREGAAPMRRDRRSPPLVFASLGTLSGRRKDLLTAICVAADTLGLRLILSHGGTLTPQECRDLPGRPRVKAFWPQREVLARSAVCITHGGMNTVLDALAAEVPMVAIPLRFEQPGIAARLAHHGLARVLAPRRVTGQTIAVALAEVLSDPAMPTRLAQAAADLTAAGGVSRAADLVESRLTRVPSRRIAA